MKLNELVCPTCGLKCLTDHAYTMCDGCGLTFYAYDSKTCNPPAAPVTILPPPTIIPMRPPADWGPFTGVVQAGGTVFSGDYQLWN